MPPGTAAQADGTPRHPLGPRDTPRSAELTAALALAVLLAHLLLAQLTLLLGAALYATGRLSRWRLQWRAVPACLRLRWLRAVRPPQAPGGGPGAACCGPGRPLARACPRRLTPQRHRPASRWPARRSGAASP